jgi:hypothetical protein
MHLTLSLRPTMPYFQILLHGILEDGVSVDGEHIRGFYVTRFAEGKEQAEAGLKALTVLGSEPQIQRLTQLREGHPPEVHIAEIRRSSWARATFGRKSGFIFYTHDPPESLQLPTGRFP